MQLGGIQHPIQKESKKKSCSQIFEAHKVYVGQFLISACDGEDSLTFDNIYSPCTKFNHNFVEASPSANEQKKQN